MKEKKKLELKKVTKEEDKEVKINLQANCIPTGPCVPQCGPDCLPACIPSPDISD